MTVAEIEPKRTEQPPPHVGLWDAFAAAQAAFQPLVKDTAGQRGKYAPLDSVLDIVRPVLNARGIALTQPTTIDGDTVLVRTVLVHIATGETHECLYPAGAIALAHQQLGAGVTYARRYSLLSLLGVFPSNEDDDGEKAGAAGGTRPIEKVRNPDTGRMVDPNSSHQLRKNGAWDSFLDKVQHYRDSRDGDGLRQWYTSDDVAGRIAKWPETWREQAEAEFSAAMDWIEAQ